MKIIYKLLNELDEIEVDGIEFTSGGNLLCYNEEELIKRLHWSNIYEIIGD